MSKRIPLTRGLFALVDDEDYEWLMQWQWYSSERYVRRVEWINGKRRQISMHRQIMSAPPGVLVDHKNGDPLDNRKSNLRFASRFGNSENSRRRKKFSSRFKGVSWDGVRGLWRARISPSLKVWHLGRFACEIDAAKAYDAAARKIFGEFATLNFPLGAEQAAFVDESQIGHGTPSGCPKRKSPTGSSVYLGVSWNGRNRKWIAQIAGRYLGSFVDEADAARAYDAAARELFGEFAFLNSPGPGERSAL